MPGKMGKTEILFERERCDECGGDKFLYRETVKQMIEEGKARPEVLEHGPYGASGIIMMDIEKPALIVPQVLIYKDYCLSCGRELVMRITRSQVQRPQLPSVQMPGQQPPGGNGGNYSPGAGDFMRRGRF